MMLELASGTRLRGSWQRPLGRRALTRRLPRGSALTWAPWVPLQEVMFGPSHNADGTTNFVGALRRLLATTGYVDLKSFQRCPVTVASSH